MRTLPLWAVLVLLGTGCADFDVEKQELCERFPARCGTSIGGDEDPDAGAGPAAPDAGTAPDAGGPPRVTNTQPLMPMTQGGGTLTFQVATETPPAGSLRFEWSATSGSLGVQEDGATTSRIQWTAPDCLPDGTPPFVTATITHSLGPFTPVRFLVGGVPDCPAWKPAGTLSVSRERFTATMLYDGRILVVGGLDGSTTLTSAELYDPVAGTVSPTSAMTVARSGHSATLLSTGQVLVAGGSNSSGPLTSAELYDPSTGTWTQTGVMANGRYFHSAVRLMNGKVLVAGGWGAIVSLNTAELYDPSAGTWSATGSLLQARHGHTLTVLAGGGVLAVGGTRTYFGSGGAPASEFLATAELFDPYEGTGTWSSTGSMAQARRAGHSATLLGSGKVLVLAGTGATAPLTTGELYDPSSRTWSSIRAMASPGRTGHGASLLGSGKVLVTGGSYGNPLRTAELYDPERDAWSSAPGMAASRTGHAAFTIPQGDALVLGGGVTGVERYEPGTGVWKRTNGMGSVRKRHTMTLLTSGQVLVTGGVDSTGARLATAELFDPLTGRWSRTGDMATPRESHTATLLSSGRVLVTGGTAENVPSEVYDPGSGSWTASGLMSLNRSSHTATLLLSGRVLVTGGTGGFASAELYDPDAGTWAYTTSMAEGRTAHAATLLPSGKVLVTGGQSGKTYLATAEIYDEVENGSWTQATSMRLPRSAHTATLLPSGQVFVAGGFRVLPGSSNELLAAHSLEATDSYASESGQWTALSNMTAGGFMLSGRHDHAAVLLPGGRVMVIGGTTKPGGSPNYYTNFTSEIHDPATGHWTPTSKTVGERRSGHRALLLPTGRVLVTGGTNDTGAELYIP
ncbi:Kelch repeat-containing protein [Pyxidicoccus caerfyrddinensis]|uniref:Kelch repeat-containing protein n=1 Tax=Pyxidicoccus caerfyrddinensis TaxID=2709663 RepID=UPI0013DCDA7C|nr:kelch repeat-containing protein [Pyxidicoccus caerfyrddinensis]